MAKVLKTAALIVGAVALVATGVGALAGAGILGSGGAFLGVAASTFATVGTIAGVGAAVLSYAAKALTKTPPVSISGNQTKFTANIDQGIPRGLGRTAISGFIVHRQTFDWSGSTPSNAFQTFFGVWSHGRSRLTDSVFQVDGATVTFGGNAGEVAQGGYNDGHNTGWMWLRTGNGATPEPAALLATGFYPYPAGWSAEHRMSGYSDFAWTLKFDASGKTYPGAAVPQPRRIDDWGPVYDPRQDSTFPGGSGPCRAGDESTYVFSGLDSATPANRNPWLQALTWALGHWNNGVRVMGIGFALASIDVPAYAAAANVADVNRWSVGGVVYSTDGKWDALKKMCAAGGGEPLQLGGSLSCIVSTPRVALATITDNDVIAAPTIPGGARIRDRLNGIIPTYRSEGHDWQLVPATKVQIADYIVADGRPRTKAVTWELVQDANQVAELATYMICDSREIDGIVLPLKLRWIGYKAGDAVNVAAPVTGMDNQLIVIRRRHLDPATQAVTVTARTETTAKHAYSLGQTTTAPPTPALQTVDRTELLQPGISASWSAVANDDGNRPDDNADVTADALPAAFLAFTGRDAKDVIADFAGVSAALGTELLRSANFRTETYQVIYMPDGTPVLTLVQALGTTVAGHTTYIAFLQQVNGETGEGKAIFTVNADGHIVGWEALAGGSNPVDQLSFLASRFLFVDNSGSNPINALTYEDGRWKLKSIEADTIAADTITTRHLVVGSVTTSARTMSVGSTNGNGGWQQVASVILPSGFAAQCDIIGQADQGYNAGVKSWGIRVLRNGTVLKTIQRTNPASYTEVPTILRSGVDLTEQQANTVSLECIGADSSVVINNADLAVLVRFA